MYPGHRGNRGRRFWRWFLVWFFCTGAVMVGGLVIEQAIDPGYPAPRNAPQSTWGAMPSSASPAAPSPSAVRTGSPSLTGPVQVVQGSQQVNGVSLGYPHSTAGAVSAADEFLTAIGGTLDPDQAAAVMRMAADPSYTNGPQQAAEGAVNDRKQLGQSASGPVPQGVSIETEPVEYQVRDVTSDRALVLLLCDFIITLPNQGTQTKVGVFPVPLHWSQSDWKILPPTPTDDYENLSADPDSPRAAELGWQELEPAGG